MGFVLTNGFFFTPAVTHAAQATSTSVNQSSETNAVDFTDRINHILEDWHKQRAKILNGDSATNVINTPVMNPVSNLTNTKPVTTEISPPVQENATPVASPIQTDKSTNSYAPTYTFDWQGTPLSQTLYSISKISGKRVVINGSLSGTVYTSLNSVTYDQALDYLAKAFNFNWMLDDNGEAILISTSDLMKQSKIFNILYADKDKLKAELVSLGIDEKNIYVNNEQSSLSVTGTPYQLSEAQRRITGIDKPVSQCLILTQLIEVSHGHDLDLGMKYTLPTYSHAAGDDLTGQFAEKLTFSASAEANRTLSKGKVIARPMIMSLNGQEATVYMGDSVPVLTSTSTTASTQVTVEYKDIGTSLKVTPIINMQNSEVSMKIDMNISNISKWVTQGSISAPQVSSRKATTTAHLKSGQSFVIGGLMNANELDNLSGIPGLMDLPILGKLFSYHSVSKAYTEVFIMVTPYIVTDDIDPKTLMRQVKE
jgi:type II secretory pathway component GspD/PulD (secretin)